eukprot:TRINITY_DN91258_c0_g1_i1.p1 TRINITY_DN91258_c0_g1~~TRINITY_DN91258_c0_g1_i1.p1  ORF type:complete len:920 (-),score=106.12 TRINITY_DN91258_c0_g1_i1:70-2829(-)
MVKLHGLLPHLLLGFAFLAGGARGQTCFVPDVDNAHPDGPCAGVNGQIENFGTCTPQCAEGFFPVDVPDNGVLLCVFGTLNPSTFACQGMPCSHPEDIENSGEDENLSTCDNDTVIPHLGWCTPRCANGYEITEDVPPDLEIGKQVLRCWAGKLYPPTFVCRGKSCPVPTHREIPKAHLTTPCSIDLKKIPHQSICKPKCQEGYHPNISSLKCWGGNLSGMFECIGNACPAPTGIRYSNIPSCEEGPEFAHGEECTPSCLPGYGPNEDYLRCVAGERIPFDFNCSGLPCIPPFTIPFGLAPFPARNKTIPLNAEGRTWETIPALSRTCKEGGVINHLGSCEAQCLDGYIPDTPFLICSFGNLNPTIYNCIGQPCPAPQNIPDAPSPSCLEGDTIEHGSGCTTQCDYGFVQSETFLTCNASVLSNNGTFSCIGQPCSPPVGIDSAASPACAEGDGIIEHGDVCTAQCLPGYIPSSEVLYCYGSQLRPAAFTCIQESRLEGSEAAGDAMSLPWVRDMAVAPLGPGIVVLCYNDKAAGTGHGSFCRVLLASATSMLQGPKIPLTDYPVHGLVLTPTFPERVAACFHKASGISCIPFEMGNDATVDMGVETEISTGHTYHLRVAYIGNFVAMTCWQQGSENWHCVGLQNVVKLRIFKGIDLITSETVADIALANLGTDFRAVVCVLLVEEERQTKCYSVKVTQGFRVLAMESSLVLSGEANFFSAVPLLNRKVLFCYSGWSHESSAICSVLTGVGGQLETQSNITVAAGVTRYFALEALGDRRALLCYERKGSIGPCLDHRVQCAGWAAAGECRINMDFMERLCPLSCGVCLEVGKSRGACSVIELDNTETLLAGEQVIFNDGESWSHTVAKLEDDTAVVCFSDTTARELGRCRLIWGKRSWVELKARLCIPPGGEIEESCVP